MLNSENITKLYEGAENDRLTKVMLDSIKPAHNYAYPHETISEAAKAIIREQARAKVVRLRPPVIIADKIEMSFSLFNVEI